MSRGHFSEAGRMVLENRTRKRRKPNVEEYSVKQSLQLIDFISVDMSIT